MRRSKVKVLQSEPETHDADAEREIEYMPPREIPLPDYPEDFPHDRTYPQFQGRNLTRGWASEYKSQKDEDDEGEMSDLDEKIRKLEKQQAEKKSKQPAVVKSNPTATKRNPLADRAPPTIAARSASSALGSRSTGTRKFAAPTATTRARTPGLPASRKPILNSTAAGNPRHGAARAASNTTLGYSKGRAVSGASRTPLEDIHKRPTDRPAGSQLPFGGGKTSLDQLLGLSLEDDREDELGGNAGDVEEDEALRDFQLDAV